MQLTLDSASLENLLELAASAARRVGSMNDVAAAPLSGDIDAIAHALGELLGNRHLLATPIAIEVDWLRQLIAKTDALATAARDLLDEVRTEGDNPRRGERLAHLVGATAEAALAAVEAGDTLADDLATHRTGG
jgi:hypothetical protein